jgi:hypothetical protein
VPLGPTVQRSANRLHDRGCHLSEKYRPRYRRAMSEVQGHSEEAISTIVINRLDDDLGGATRLQRSFAVERFASDNLSCCVEIHVFGCARFIKAPSDREPRHRHIPAPGKQLSTWPAVARGRRCPPSLFELRRGSLLSLRERRLVAGRTRTCNQTVMRSRPKRTLIDFSALLTTIAPACGGS